MKVDKYDKYKLELIQESKLIEIFNDLKSDMKHVKDNPNYQEMLDEELKFLNGWCDVIICAINRHDLLLEQLKKYDCLMEKYEINSIEELEEILKDYDDMAKDIVEMATGRKVDIKQ